MKTRMVARRSLPRLLALMLVLSAVLGSGLRTDATARPAAARTAASPLDLPAMTLTPADLDEAGLPGFGVAYVGDHDSGWRTIGDVAYDSPAHQADGFGNLTLDQIDVKLSQTGWRRQYRRILAIPDPADPTSVDESVFSEVAEYDDAEGADAALTLLTQGGQAEESADDLVGDRLEIRRDVLYRVGSRLTVMFRDGNLLGSVQIIRYATEEGAERAPALLLAHRLQERIAAGVAHPGDDLSGMVLRVATVASPAKEEGYLRLDGEAFPYFGESEADLASRVTAFRDSIDVYEMLQLLEQSPGEQVPTVFLDRLYRFPDEAAAAAWLEALPQGLAEDAANSGGSFAVEQLADSTPIGDESLAFAVTLHPEQGTLRSFRIYTRVGSYGARVQFGGAEEPPLSVAEALATAQADCLRAGECAEAFRLPGDLAGLSCPPTSQTETPSPTAVTQEFGAVPMHGGDPRHSGAHPGPGPSGAPQERWQFVAPGGAGRGPIVADGLLYVASTTYRDGPIVNLHAIDAATGTQRWCVTTGREVSDPVFADGLVFTEGREIPGDHEQAFVVALAAATGVERWRFAIDPILDPDSGGITVADGTVYVGTGMGALFALDASTGKARWLSKLGDWEEIDYVCPPAVADGVLYVADNQTLHAVDAATGEILWRFRAEADDEDFDTPTVADGIVYVAGWHTVYAVDARSGEEVWKYAPKRPSIKRLAVVDGVLYLSTGAKSQATGPESVSALDAASGRRLWQYDTEGYVSTPVVVGNVVYVGTGVEQPDGQLEGDVRALSAADGEELWSYPVDGIATTPVVIGGQVYVGSERGQNQHHEQTVYAIGGTAATSGITSADGK